MKHKTRTKALSWLLSLALMLSLVPALGTTARAATYSGHTDDLQADDILKPGARYSRENITVILQANGWGGEYEMSTSEKNSQ